MKKISLFTLLLLFSLYVFPQKVTVDGIVYKIEKNEALVISSDYEIEKANILSHVEYNGKKYAVTAVGRSSFLEWKLAFPFNNRVNLKFVSIPNTVKSIALDAFAGCHNLTDIILPDGKVEINAGYKDPTRKVKNHLSFYDCNSITSVRCQNGRIPVEIISKLPEYCPFVLSYQNGKLDSKNLSNSIQVSPNSQIQKSNSVTEHTNVKINNVGQKSKTISDVDINIPTFSSSNKNTFAVIIANEEYVRESNVDFANNDGMVFKKYCNQVLGIPEKNIHTIHNGTLNDMIYELDWIEQVCKAYKGEASLLFYYAGHGIPGENNGKAYLLPVDGSGKNLRTCYSTDELYKFLGDLPTKKIVVFMDACFSGTKRGGEIMTSARGVAIKVKTSSPKGKMIVLSAAQGDETAYSYNDKNHGLFTYFLLKKLKESNGTVSIGDLSEYIRDQVRKHSIVENGKSQSPTVIASPVLGETWKKMKLK